MTRLPDWQRRLEALIQQRMAAPFVWGVRDCCLWPADVVLEMTGVDLAADLRGTYKTAAGAARALKKVGGIAGAFGRVGEPIAPLCAGVGDVGVVATETQRQCGAVCVGGHWIVASTLGLGPVELRAAEKAWRVGDA